MKKFQNIILGLLVGLVLATGTAILAGSIGGAGISGSPPVDLTNLSATNLTSGTVPDARFPATLPAASGVNLTALNASNLGSGTVPDARFPATLPAASAANLTAIPAANITGTLPAISGANLTSLTSANLTGALPAISGAALTNLPAPSNIIIDANNTTLGTGAGDSITSGTKVTAVGVNAATAITTQTGSNTTAIGEGALQAVVSGLNNTACGFNAGLTTTGAQNSYFGSLCGDANISGTRQAFGGYNSGGNCTGSDNAFWGHNSGQFITSGTQNACLGSAASPSANVSDTVSVGYNAAPAASTSMCFGSNSFTTASNQLVFGANTLQITDVYFSEGVTNASSLAATINGTGGSGADNAGGGFILAGGKGTGTAKGGNVLIQTSSAIATSSTAQTLRDRYIVVAKGTALTDATPVTLATVTLGANGYAGGRIICTVQCTNATDQQAFTQIVEWGIVTKASTYTSTIVASTGAKAVSGGTIVNTWTITAAGAIQLSSDTSLTPSGTNAFVAYYTIENNSEVNITLP